VTSLNRVNNAATILVVEDDPRIQELIKTSLETEGFSVFEAASSEALYRILAEEAIDLITMDILLDRENGLDLVRDIRKRSEIPIILVTGRVDLIDTVLGLELGADDYITKPFLIRELIARVRSVLRRARIAAVPAARIRPAETENDFDFLKFGNWTFIPASRELRDVNDEPVALTTTEYDLLEIFVSSPQRVLTRDHLMETLNGRHWQPSDRVIDNHVAQLRKKLESTDEAEWIKTVRGVGYLFTGKVSRSTQTQA
jgi:two-component system OmpR family response regulator